MTAPDINRVFDTVDGPHTYLLDADGEIVERVPVEGERIERWAAVYWGKEWKPPANQAKDGLPGNDGKRRILTPVIDHEGKRFARVEGPIRPGDRFVTDSGDVRFAPHSGTGNGLGGDWKVRELPSVTQNKPEVAKGLVSDPARVEPEIQVGDQFWHIGEGLPYPRLSVTLIDGDRVELDRVDGYNQTWAEGPSTLLDLSKYRRVDTDQSSAPTKRDTEGRQTASDPTENADETDSGEGRDTAAVEPVPSSGEWEPDPASIEAVYGFFPLADDPQELMGQKNTARSILVDLHRSGWLSPSEAQELKAQIEGKKFDLIDNGWWSPESVRSFIERSNREHAEKVAEIGEHRSRADKAEAEVERLRDEREGLRESLNLVGASLRFTYHGLNRQAGKPRWRQVVRWARATLDDDIAELAEVVDSLGPVSSPSEGKGE